MQNRTTFAIYISLSRKPYLIFLILNIEKNIVIKQNDKPLNYPSIAINTIFKKTVPFSRSVSNQQVPMRLSGNQR